MVKKIDKEPRRSIFNKQSLLHFKTGKRKYSKIMGVSSKEYTIYLSKDEEHVRPNSTFNKIF